MAKQKTKSLSPGYTAEVDTVDKRGWYQYLREFDDANIFQTWAYGAVTSGRGRMSHLVVRRNGELAAIAQAKIVKIPFINVGIAYIRWGPLWELSKTGRDPQNFRQALRALRNEYVCNRGLVLRLFPSLFEEDGVEHLREIMAEEGFLFSRSGAQARTILMDLRPSLESLRSGMGSQSRRHLRLAERANLDFVDGSEDHLFELFLNIYEEMVSRKGFVPGVDIRQFRQMQTLLPNDFKMRISLCHLGEEPCAGLISSSIGKSAIYLFGATSNAGIKSRGSYLLQWKLIEELKRCGVSIYDLYGINPKKNPGTYAFKSGIAGKNGREVSSLGRFDSHVSSLGHSCIQLGDSIRIGYRRFREFARTSRSMRPLFKTAQQVVSSTK